MKNTIFISIFLLCNTVLYAQKTGDVPQYANYTDLNIGLTTSLNYSFSSRIPPGKAFLGSDFTLTGAYKPKNYPFQFGLSFGELNRLYSFPNDKDNPIQWAYLSTGLFADFLPWQKGNSYIRLGVNYNLLMKADNKYAYFKDIKTYEPSYGDLMLGAGLKAFQYGHFSLWINASYRYAINNVWTIFVLNADGSTTDTPTTFNEVLLGVGLKYHNSKYYGKR